MLPAPAVLQHRRWSCLVPAHLALLLVLACRPILPAIYHSLWPANWVPNHLMWAMGRVMSMWAMGRVMSAMQLRQGELVLQPFFPCTVQAVHEARSKLQSVLQPVLHLVHMVAGRAVGSSLAARLLLPLLVPVPVLVPVAVPMLSWLCCHY